MRFAYIDSQGNEVTIPSVDALALRIELGAIVPETELYDAQADRWGPAHSHEIFHTLSRDVGGEDFLVPAPPPAPGEPEPGEPDDEAPTPEASAGEPPAQPPEPAPTFGDTFGLTLSPSEESDGEGPETDRVEIDQPAPSEPSLSEFELDLTPSEEQGDRDARSEPSGGGSHAAATPETEDDVQKEALDFGASAAGAAADDDSAVADDDGLDLEMSLDFAEDTSDAEFGGEMDLEPPMSDFDPSSPPMWMEQDGPGGADDTDGPVMDFSPDAEEPTDEITDWGEAPEPSRPEPEQPARPKAPSRPVPRRAPRRRRSKAPWVVLLLTAVAGTGGWYGWQAYANRPAPEPPRPPVVIPTIPAELEAPMREIAASALTGMYEDIEGEAFGPEDPEAPSDEWLAGIYLGNASRFDAVEVFWAGIGSFADHLREEELQAFHDAFVSRAEAAEYEGGPLALMVARADSGFLATREGRLDVYLRLGTLADAALALHDFLLMHEPDIAYTPARTFAGNPIEEAVPATAEIGDQMWDRVEDITNALDALGTLDRVTRERLSTVLLQRIQDVGIR
ncbi:MAG: hypothetical protein WD995_12765 [Gemmatimonadota bacterium]